jgi:hypothetical protein
MLKLAMAARRSYVLPAVMLQQSDNFADLHVGSTGEFLAISGSAFGVNWGGAAPSGHSRRSAAVRPSELP